MVSVRVYLILPPTGIIYPASSWFLLRQTREKPLRATVCFSIEHGRARHAPRDAIDVNFICQLIFRWKRFGTKEFKYIYYSIPSAIVFSLH